MRVSAVSHTGVPESSPTGPMSVGILGVTEPETMASSSSWEKYRPVFWLSCMGC